MESLEKMIDLYLGSDLGLWALQQTPPASICQVFTLDEAIAKVCRQLGIRSYLENANSVEFIPAKTALSVHYPKILKPHLISRYHKIYNLHPAYLPWGKGYYPIFWSLWENTPAGATLHEINEGIDQGKIVAQIQVEYYEHDTGGSLFKRVREAEKQLFLDYWQKIAEGIELPSHSQIGEGTYHSKRDFFNLKTQVNWQEMTGQDLIKLIRCLTFEGYTGLEIELETKIFEINFKMKANDL